MNNVRFAKWNGLDAVYVSNDLSDGIITLMGAHVVSFTPKGSQDLLWISGKSIFQVGKAIRGGIPVCWPWFGKAATPGHGFARTSLWTVDRSALEEDGSTRLELSFQPEREDFAFLSVKLFVTFGKSLKLELVTANNGKEDFVLGEAFHTYFNIGDIHTASVTGLDKVDYLDNCDSLKTVTQQGDVVFTAETDRIYTSKGTVVINDPKKQRKIRIEKNGSNNTVVWNPWIAKSIAMADFGDQEYPGMVCVEAANAFAGRVTLAPGKSNSMSCIISEEK